MRTTKVFKCGNSQAVRFPKDFQLNSDEVEGIPKSLAKAFELLTHLPEDFFLGGRKDSPPQKRNF